MPPKRPPRKPSNAPQWEPPRGISYEHRPNRPKPFLLIWRDETAPSGRRKLSFKTESERELVAKDKASVRERFGTEGLNYDPAKWRSYLELEKLCEAEGSDPRTVFMEWRDLKREKALATGATVGMTVTEAWPKYSDLRKKEDDLSDDTWRHLEKHIGERFVGAFGKRRLNELTATMIRAWLDGLTHPRTKEPMEPVTKGHHLKDVRNFLARCVVEGWMLKNPCDSVKPPKGGNGEDEDESNDEETDDGYRDPLPVREVFEFFKVNRDNPVAIRVALEAFGGVRYKTAARLKHENFNYIERGVELPGAIHKSGNRKFRQGHPENLWDWLELARDEKHPAWSMTLRQYAEAKRMALTVAKLREFVATTEAHRERLKELRNVWRRSFASYMIAKLRAVPMVSYLMQHKRTATTEIYEGRATHADAVLFCAITPESVLLTWEAFVKKYALPAPAAKTTTAA